MKKSDHHEGRLPNLYDLYSIEKASKLVEELFPDYELESFQIDAEATGYYYVKAAFTIREVKCHENGYTFSSRRSGLVKVEPFGDTISGIANDHFFLSDTFNRTFIKVVETIVEKIKIKPGSIGLLHHWKIGE